MKMRQTHGHYGRRLGPGNKVRGNWLSPECARLERLWRKQTAMISPQTKLKITLKTALSKLQFTQEKRIALTKQSRRQLADLLKNGREASAKIRVENIIREDIYVELLEMLELYCELLLARIGLLDNKECEPGLVEAVKTIIYAAPHTDVKELKTVAELLAHRFGPEFYASAIENRDSVVPEKIVKRVQIEPPSPELVSLYLKEIARAYEVPFSELTDEEDDLDQLENEANEISDSDDDNGGTPEAPVPVAVPAVPTEPAVGTKPASAPKSDIDLLKQRFAALKKIS